MHDTGVAIVNPPPDGEDTTTQSNSANITVSLYDKQSNLIARNDLDPLSAGHHLARYLHEMFENLQVKVQEQEMEGISRRN